MIAMPFLEPVTCILAVRMMVSIKNGERYSSTATATDYVRWDSMRTILVSKIPEMDF